MSSSQDRVVRFVETLRDDPRVLGIARRPDVAGLLPECASVLVVTTWDGLEPLVTEAPRALAAAFGDEPTKVVGFGPEQLTALGADGVRLDVEFRRIGDLKPSGDGDGAAPLFDPRGLIEQWTRYSAAAAATGAFACTKLDHDRAVVEADLRLRMYEGERVLLLPEDGGRLRHVREDLSPTAPVDAALRARIDALLRSLPRPGAGERFVGGPGRDEHRERFLKTADDEGFKGDRVLFDAAAKRLSELAKRETVFDEGFVLPTFDAVEAAFSVGEAVGGCKPPLVPGVYVGVGVTPRDALEFWAAPCVRFAGAPIACIDDAGERDVVERSAGRDAMLGALLAAVDAAFERLPALIEAARAAARDSVDPAAVLKALHLPRSFVERAKRRGADALLCSRLTVAIALVRAGHDAAPLVARKLGLAAGRVIAAR